LFPNSNGPIVVLIAPVFFFGMGETFAIFYEEGKTPVANERYKFLKGFAKEARLLC
jgi:hypothetical protein